MAKEHNIKVNLVQIKITEVGSHVDTADLLVTTAMTKTEYPFPVINARAFLTGIGMEDTKKQILDELHKIICHNQKNRISISLSRNRDLL